MFDICSVWNPLTPWSMVDCSTSVPMMIAHCTVDLTAHVTRSRDQTLFWAVFEGSRRTNKKRFPPGNLSLFQILVLVFKRYVVIQYVCSLLCRLRGGGVFGSLWHHLLELCIQLLWKLFFFRIQTLWFSFIFHIEEILYSSLACAETDNDEIYM